MLTVRSASNKAYRALGKNLQCKSSAKTFTPKLESQTHHKLVNSIFVMAIGFWTRLIPQGNFLSCIPSSKASYDCIFFSLSASAGGLQNEVSCYFCLAQVPLAISAWPLWEALGIQHGSVFTNRILNLQLHSWKVPSSDNYFAQSDRKQTKTRE